jgi:hypothetical protein
MQFYEKGLVQGFGVKGFGVRRDWSFVASAAEKALRFDDPVFLRTGSLSRQAS